MEDAVKMWVISASGISFSDEVNMMASVEHYARQLNVE